MTVDQNDAVRAVSDADRWRDGDGHLDEDEPDSSNSDDVDNDSDGAVDEDDEPDNDDHRRPPIHRRGSSHGEHEQTGISLRGTLSGAKPEPDCRDEFVLESPESRFDGAKSPFDR